MRVSLNYSTHLPALIKALEKTTGDVLELGMGVFSTPYLHYACMLSNRKLVSYENYKDWAEMFISYGYENDFHKLHVVDEYSKADIDKEWGVALIDQTPDKSRVEEAIRLAKLAKIVVLHDSNERYNYLHDYNKVYPLFKHKHIWSRDERHATVLSNFINLQNFWR